MTVTRPAKSTKKLAFPGYKATKALEKLAKKPYDLTAENALTPERVNQFIAKASGYKLLYATQRIDEQVMDALWNLAEEAKVFEKMEAMQEGEVINQIIGFESDERAVLHTAMRDLFNGSHLSKDVKIAANLAKDEHTKLKNFLQRVDEEGRFTNLLLIGIGGSNLGPEALYTSLEHLQIPDRTVRFISNIDPDDPASAVEDLNLSKTLVGVISKSGSTLETISNESFIRSKFEERGLNSNEHFLAVTGKGSPMDDPSRYLECFHAWDYVGGRFCSTAIYGGLPLSFGLGYDTFSELLRGAHSMDQAAMSDDRTKNLPLLLALLGVWNHNFLGHPTCAMVPYSHALRRFSAHIQQVDMESNGKHIDRMGNRVTFETGPIIWGEPGTNAQHSFFQLIHQGTPIVPLEIVGFLNSQRGEDLEVQGSTNQEKLIANFIAQSIALAQGQDNENPNRRFEGNRPSSLLLAKRLTPFAMGAIFALYEHKVAFQGFIWDINSFDQEGVQLGKVLALNVLESQMAKKEGKEGSFPVGDEIWSQLESLD